MALIAPNIIKDLNLNAWELSTVFASLFYAFSLMQIPVVFLDSIGPRITMTLLSLVAVVRALLFSMGESYNPLTIGRVLLGIGMACNFMGILNLITIWFDPKHFTILSAVIVSASIAGNIAVATQLVIMVQIMEYRPSGVPLVSGICLAIINACYTLTTETLTLKKTKPPKVIT